MLIDISQEVFSCKVFPGDPAPEFQKLLSIEKNDVCNLTAFSMCAHNGTHIDAPFHFMNDGKTLDELGLEPFVGDCYVARYDGDVLALDAVKILQNANAFNAEKRILIAGKATVT
jgi:Predicted metal-dependent hydrolase